MIVEGTLPKRMVGRSFPTATVMKSIVQIERHGSEKCQVVTAQMMDNIRHI